MKKIEPIGFVTCLGCLAPPKVDRVPGSRRFDRPARFVAWCFTKSCMAFESGETLDLVMAAWNERNHRL